MLDQQPRSILLISDQESTYSHFHDLLDELEPHACRLEWCSDLAQARRALHKGQHNLYLLAESLAGPAGGEILGDMTKNGLSQPVILLLNQNTAAAQQAALTNGAIDFLLPAATNADTFDRTLRYALGRAYLQQQLNDLAIRDELTGLYNQRELNRLLDEEASRSRRYQSTLSLVMIDIDHIKEINQTYGRQIGDEVMRWVAQILLDSVRTVDRVTRYAGDEFVVLLPETHAEEALQVADRLRQNVHLRHFTFVLEDGTMLQFPISVSVGLAELPGDTDSKEALIAMADRALLEAKRHGRNQTIAYSSLNLWNRNE